MYKGPRQAGSAPRVLYGRATGSSCKVKNSQGTVLGEMLAALGCVNIADSETGLLETLSMETILAEDPEHIFVVLQGSDTTRAEQTLEMSLLSNPAWNELTAVAEDVLTRWSLEKQGVAVNRELPKEYLFFNGYHGSNHFRTEC